MILLIADSICGGFGQRDKKSFVHKAAESLGIEIWDESATGMSSNAYLEHLRTGLAICPEQQMPLSNLDNISLVVISLGNVDGKKTYTKKNLLGILVPSRYRKEKIDPRPYYSKHAWKYLFEKIDNLARHLFRHYAFYTGNLENNVPLDRTKKNISKILARFHSKKIVIISTSSVKEFYFPGAPRNFLEINNFLEEQSSKNIVFFDMQSKINKSYLLDDKFHLNSEGHEAIKHEFISLINAINGRVKA